jgi:predicted nucleic acid-binding protein
MSAGRGLVVDANILLRGVFGVRVRELLTGYAETVSFYTPDICVEDTLKYIPSIARRRGIDPVESEENLMQLLTSCINVIEMPAYEKYETWARERIAARDADDWPVVATALLLDAPIWTEDQDFFDSGIATWTSNRIEVYLRDV